MKRDGDKTRVPSIWRHCLCRGPFFFQSILSARRKSGCVKFAVSALQNWQKSILLETSGPRAQSSRRFYFLLYVFLIWMNIDVDLIGPLVTVGVLIRVSTSAWCRWTSECETAVITLDIIWLWIGWLNWRSLLSWSEEALCCRLDSQLELLAVWRLLVLPLCARVGSLQVPLTLPHSHSPKTCMIRLISSS